LLRFGVLFILLTTSVFAQTECYFDTDFRDGTYGFFLQDKEITLMHPYSKFTTFERDKGNLIYQNEIVGELIVNALEGMITIGKDASTFKCTVWRPGGRG